MATITKPLVLVELNGGEPLHIAHRGACRIMVLDWDEVREGGTSSEELIRIHDAIEHISPHTARSIRDALRRRGVQLPSAYENET